MKKEIPYWPLMVSGIIILIVWILTFIVIRFSFSDYEKMGQFGDLFGCVNALFSGLAFAGLIYTIYLQKNELYNTKKELEKTEEKQELQLKLYLLNSKLTAYSIILNPQAGMKNRVIDNTNIQEDDVKKKFICTLNEIEKLEN